MSSSAHGYFVWHDLITTDIPAAINFYKKVVGWKTQPFDPEGKYQMWTGKNGPVGGIGAAETGTPAHWRPYIGTDDIAATIALAEKLGGSVVTPATDIPNGGKWAVLKDPQDNEFGLYWSANHSAPEMKMEPGEFHWHELATNDHKTAFGFYQKLFGWQAGVEHNISGMGIYALFKNEGRPHGMGGMFNKPASTHGGWCVYTVVKDVGKSAATISKLGGKNTHEPVQVPGGSWTVKFIDPQGVPHALTSSENASAKVEEKKEVAVKPKAKTSASKTATTPAKKSSKKKSVKKISKQKVVGKKPTPGKKPAKKSDKKKKKQEKKLKKLKKKMEKKEKKQKKKDKAKRKK